MILSRTMLGDCTGRGVIYDGSIGSGIAHQSWVSDARLYIYITVPAEVGFEAGSAIDLDELGTARSFLFCYIYTLLYVFSPVYIYSMGVV